MFISSVDELRSFVLSLLLITQPLFDWLFQPIGGKSLSKNKFTCENAVSQTQYESWTLRVMGSCLVSETILTERTRVGDRLWIEVFLSYESQDTYIPGQTSSWKHFHFRSSVSSFTWDVFLAARFTILSTGPLKILCKCLFIFHEDVQLHTCLSVFKSLPRSSLNLQWQCFATNLLCASH